MLVIQAGNSELVPARWSRVKLDTVQVVRMSCPTCGVCQFLDDHQVGPDGMVTPSVQCATQDCPFHDTVQLAGWTAGHDEPTD